MAALKGEVGGDMKQVIITVNGPGEISAWLTPVSRAIKAASPETKVVACLVPCVFSSGSERGVIERIETVDAVAGVGESFGLMLKKRWPDGFDPEADNLILHLGGELALTRLLSRRIAAPVFAYIEQANPVLKHFERIFYNGLNEMPPRIGNRETEGIGEMMVDSALAKVASMSDADREPNTVAIFAGSRSYMAEFLLPYFAAAADRIARERPDVRFVLPMSDYVGEDFYRTLPEPPEDRDWEATKVAYRSDEDRAWMETAAGTRIELVSNRDVLARAGAAMTLPGTNTGELAAAGVPMVTVIPTYRRCAEAVPLPGLAGHVTRIPIIGNKIKVFAAGLALKKHRLLSIPSRRAGRRIAPELIGRALQPDIAREVIALIDDESRTVGRAVQAAMGAPGAADRLAGEIISRLAAAPIGHGVPSPSQDQNKTSADAAI